MACLNPYCAGRCSSTENGNEDKAKQHYVSILVVLDDALVLFETATMMQYYLVSILVVLDDALVLY